MTVKNILISAFLILFICFLSDAKRYKDIKSFTDPAKILMYGVINLESSRIIQNQPDNSEPILINFSSVLYDTRTVKNIEDAIRSIFGNLPKETKLIISASLDPKTRQALDNLLINQNLKERTSLYFHPDKIKLLSEFPRDFARIPKASNNSLGIHSPLRDLKALDKPELTNQYLLECPITDFFFDYNSISKWLDNHLQGFENYMREKKRSNFSVILRASPVQSPIYLDINYKEMFTRFLYTWAAENEIHVAYNGILGNPTWNEIQTWVGSFLRNYNNSIDNEYSFSISSSDSEDLPWEQIQHEVNHVMFNIEITENEDNDTVVKNFIRDALLNTANTNLSVSFLVDVKADRNSIFLQEIIQAVENASDEHPERIIKSLVLKFPSISCTNLNHSTAARNLLEEINTEQLKSKNISFGLVDCKVGTSEHGIVHTNLPTNPDGLYDLVLIQDLPKTITDSEKMTKLKKHIDLYGEKKKILVEGYWSPAEDKRLPKNENSCYGLKKYWTSLLEWAKVFKYQIQVQLSSQQSRSQPDPPKAMIPWFKTASQFFNSSEKEPDKEEMKFLSNFQDTCVVLDDTPPKIDFEWNAAVGVTFNLSRVVFREMKPSWILGFLELVHFKYDVVELAVDKKGDQSSILEALLDLEEKIGSANFSKFDYYVNLGDCDRVTAGRVNTSGVGDLMRSKRVKGTHIDLTVNTELDLDEVEDSIQTLSTLYGGNLTNKRGVGVVVEYTGDPKLTDPEKKLFRVCDYVIVNIDVTRVLTLKEGIKNESTLTPSDVYDKARNYFELNGDYYDFQDIFNNLKAFRFNCWRVKSNLTVMLRLRYPLFPETGGMGIFLQFWKFVDEFSFTFQFPFFVYEAFDDISSLSTCSDTQLRYGWWKAQNESVFKNPTTWIEHQSEYFKKPTPIPSGNFTEPEEPSSDANKIAIAITACLTALFTVLVVILFIWLRQKNKVISDLEINDFIHGKKVKKNEKPDPIFGERYNAAKYEVGKHEFCKESSQIIGMGNFGLVYKAHMSRFKGEVAVKAPRAEDRDSDSSDLAQQVRSCLCEIKTMSHACDHPNILKLLGAYTKEAVRGTVLVITKYCENGALLNHLRNIKDATPVSVMYDLYRFCQEIATGMVYLKEMTVVHGDLAARNVLLDQNMTCKISDFGLSLKIDRYSSYQRKCNEPLPWAWMSPESLVHLDFTLSSDIWSMGVIFWEIFTLGEQPYSGESWNDEFVHKLEEGLRLKQPKYATDDVFKEIETCWEYDPAERNDPSYYLQFFQVKRRSAYESM